MASFAMVLGVVKGEASLLGAPADHATATKQFKTIVFDGGVSGAAKFDELWLCDTIQGRLRRKAFCHAEPVAAETAPAPRARKAKF